MKCLIHKDRKDEILFYVMDECGIKSTDFGCIISISAIGYTDKVISKAINYGPYLKDEKDKIEDFIWIELEKDEMIQIIKQKNINDKHVI